MSEKEFPYRQITISLKHKYGIEGDIIYSKLMCIFINENKILVTETEDIYLEFYNWFISKEESYIKSIITLIKLGR